MGFKRQPEENIEGQGKPVVVECDLAAEEKTIKFGGNMFSTKCSWDVVPEKKKKWDEL